MKKLLVMVMLLCSMCAVCFAKLEQPTDDRWAIIGGQKGDFEIWIDVNTIMWKDSSEIGHTKHKAARVWVRTLNYKDSYDSLFCCEYDFDCVTARFLSSIVRDDKGTVLESVNREDLKGEIITPGSSFEAIYNYLTLFESAKNDKQVYEIYINALKKTTQQYKNGEFDK